MNSLEEINNKIEQLERDKIAYLEVDDKAGAKRKEKQIENLDLQKEVLKLDQIKKELQIYKEVVKKYPSISTEIKIRLQEMK